MGNNKPTSNRALENRRLPSPRVLVLLGFKVLAPVSAQLETRAALPAAITKASVSGLAAMTATALYTTALQYDVPTSVWLGMFGIIMALLAQGIYNLYMHPLAQFPGPWYLAISRLPITWQLLSGKQPHWAHKLHQVYGPIVRVAPGQLSFSDGRAWQDINASTKYAKYGMEKDERLNELVGGAALNPDPNMSPQAQTHTQMRRAFAPGLTKSALRQQERIIHGHVDELISELRGLAQDRAATVSMVRVFNFLSYNVISDLFLGESLNLFKSTAYHSWLDSLGGFARATVAMGALQHFFIARHVLAFVIRHFGEKSRQQFMAPCFDLFDQRLKRESERPDLVTLATREKSSTRESLPLDDMRAFSPFLILAGGETTPTGLSGLFYLLLRNKKKLDRLTREIRGAFESDKDMNIAKLHQLRYLTVCIEEGLRVYPPVPAGFERVVPSSGAPIAGHFVPGGTVVVIPALSTFLSGQNFASPDEFAPERWMENKEDRFSTDCATAFKPFSVGPHACFGQDLAQYVLRLALAKILYNFDFELHEDSTQWMEGQQIYFMWIKPELKVIIKRRAE